MIFKADNADKFEWFLARFIPLGNQLQIFECYLYYSVSLLSLCLHKQHEQKVDHFLSESD